MRRVTVGGDALEGFSIPGPACHVKIYLPAAGEDDPALPTWGPAGPQLPESASRPIIRTYTPRRFDAEARTLDLELVLHGAGPAAAWAAAALPGARLAIAGPGRPFILSPGSSPLIVGGDESALPAIASIIEALPPDDSAHVFVELAHSTARQALPPHPGVDVTWLDRNPAGPSVALADAVEPVIEPGVRAWVAGEAAAIGRLRQHVLVERGIPRSVVVTRVYWRAGATGGDLDDA